MAPVRFGLVGVGGYAEAYHQAIATLSSNHQAQLVAVAEWNQEKFGTQLRQLTEKGVKIYRSFDEMIAQCRQSLDIIGLPVGIHLHAPMTIRALQAGLNVICEKPVAATIQEVNQMIQVRDQQQKQVVIGYQEIYSPSIQRLKKLMVQQKLGKLISIKVKGGWPRPLSYYHRNNWGGRLKINQHWVLDGPANNALAHYINNMLYVASAQPESSALPVSVQAELYRTWDNETYDTVSFRAQLDNGAKLLFIASHCTDRESNPEMTLRCEQATVIRKFQQGETTIYYHNGQQEKFDDQSFNARQLVFEAAIDLLQGGHPAYCSLEIGRAQTLCVNGMHESCPRIFNIPSPEIYLKEKLFENGERASDYFKVINGIDQLIEAAYQHELLFSEMKISWARKTAEFELLDYQHFPCGKITTLEA